MTAERPPSGPRALVFTGLGSVALGVPLAVLGNAMGPYDDPKAWALPILVALTGLAWLASRRDPIDPAADASDAHARVLRWILLACLAWSAITTLTSVAPAQSLLGTFGRGMGLLTVASATLLFFLIQSECRTPGALRRLVDVVLFGSVPVGLLALGQAARWDPLPRVWDPAVTSMTVRSTFGSHIFLGSYLVMIIPLTAARLEWACREWRGAGSPRPAVTSTAWLRSLIATAWVAGALVLIGLAFDSAILGWALVPWGVAGAAAWARYIDRDEKTADSLLTISLLAGLLAAHVLVVVISRGRGAFIGVLVGLSATTFAFLIRYRAWKTLTAAAVALVGLVAFLVLLNWPGSPVAALGQLRLLGRLSNIANFERGSPSGVRLDVWRGIADGWSRQLRGEAIIPGLSPRIRSLIGYGLESQLIVLEPLTLPFVGVYHASGDGWRAHYVFDRAHSVLLDHLVTEGLIGAALWVAFIGGVLVVGALRLRTSATGPEATIRIGALGAVLGHVADGMVGIATPMPLALFSLAAALLTRKSCRALPNPVLPRRNPSTPWWATAMVAAALLVMLVAWFNTRWLLASVAYADGARHGIAGRLGDAYRDFQRSISLTPWLPLPAEAAAYAAFRMAAGESDPARRLEILGTAEAAVAQSRRYAMGGVGSWALTAQIAFAEARTGAPSRFIASRDAFAVALRLRPGDPRLLAQSAWVWLESGDALQARQMAEQALARDPGEWLAWAALARASKALGNVAEAEHATGRARGLAPPDALRLLDPLLP